jgi:hypothetical protein
MDVDEFRRNFGERWQLSPILVSCYVSSNNFNYSLFSRSDTTADEPAKKQATKRIGFIWCPQGLSMFSKCFSAPLRRTIVLQEFPPDSSATCTVPHHFLSPPDSNRPQHSPSTVLPTQRNIHSKTRCRAHVPWVNTIHTHSLVMPTSCSFGFSNHV